MAKVILPEGTAAATPAAGTVVFYAKTDGLLYSKDDAGTETPLGSNGSTALSVGSIELGHASDTTLTRTGAGKIAVEGSAVILASGGNLTGGINSARGNITQHATTMDFFAVTSPDILDGTGGAVTITACVNAPQAGATRKFYPIVATVLTHGATFDIVGNANLTAAAGDCWIIEAKTVSTYRVSAVKEDGTAVAASTGFRNRIINGAFKVDQRNAYAAQTITAAAALAYTADRWYAYCTGANVTGQVVAGASQSQKRYRFTGAASVTAIGFGTRLEAKDTYDLNNTTVTIAADLANSLLTTVTWTLYRATTTDDTFGSLASPAVTSLATGTFTVNSTVTRYSTQVSVPAAATTGLQLVLSVGAQTSGTWTIGDVQLEAGSSATTFEHRPYGTELALCQRYYYRMGGSNTCVNYGLGSNDQTSTAAPLVSFPVPMRANSSALEQSGSATDYSVKHGVTTTACNGVPTFISAGVTGALVRFTTTAALTVGQAGYGIPANANAYLGFSAEL